MMDNLYDCIRGLSSSKAAERKKSVTRLEELLNTSLVIENLDSNTVQRRKKVPTWDFVLKEINCYVDAEISSLLSAKDSQSIATLNNREKKKQELAALFKFVVKTANSRGGKLSCGLLVESVVHMLSDDYTLKAFGAVYSHVLLKTVLRVRAYWLEIRPEQWRKLALMFFKLYEDESLDRAITAAIIQDVMQGCALQGGSFSRRVFSFFTSFMTNVKELKIPSVLESILTSLNIYCQAVARSNRAYLCHFGESQLSGFLNIWVKASTDKIKDEVINFLHLLVRVHHPAGTAEEAEGAYADNWQLWKNQLCSLHEVIVNIIDQMTDRYKFVSGSKIVFLQPNLISFAADVFKQLPSNKLIPSDFVLPDSQSLPDHTVSEIISSLPAKRQRLSTENKALLEIINECSNNLQALPWLQILHCLLSKYPHCFDETRLSVCLHLLGNVLAECKRGQLFQFVFEALSALIQAMLPHEELKSQKADLIQQVWSYCISTVNSRQAEVEGYQEHGFSTMACMVRCGLISPVKEIWNLFLPAFSRPSLSADQLLTALISTQGLPESYRPSIIGATFDKNHREQSSAFPLRKALIIWLLPGADADKSGQIKVNVPSVRVAEILYALTLLQPSCNLLTSVYSTCSCDLDSLQMELSYLKMSFNSPTQCSKSHTGRRSKLGEELASCDNPHISSVLEFVVQHLNNFTDPMNVMTQSMETMAWFSCVLARLVYLLWEHQSVTDSLQCILKRALEKTAAAFVSHVRKDGLVNLQPTIASLSAMLSVEGETTLRTFSMFEFIRSCFPADLVACLIDIASGKLNKKQEGDRNRFGRQQLVSTGKDVAGSSKLDLDLDFDEFFDDPRSRLTNSNHNNKTHQEPDFGADNSEPGTSDGSIQAVHSFLKETLSDADQIQIQCAKLLCLLTAYDRRQAGEFGSQISIRAVLDCDHVKGRLLYLINSDSFHPYSAVHVHLLMTITQNLLTCHHMVTKHNIKTILGAFKQTAKELRLDQQVCCSIVTHLRCIIPHLSDPEDLPSKDLKFCQDTFFKFMDNFWLLASDGTTKLKLEIAKTLLDLLKYDPNCSWGCIQIPPPPPEEDGEPFSYTVSQIFPKYLSETDVEIQSFVAENLKWLFIHPGKCNEIFKSRKLQTIAFESVFQLCDELFNIQQGNISEARWTDEITCRVATLLQSMHAIITISPVCEKSCLLGLCQIIASRNIPLRTVKKMLSKVCQELKYPSIRAYLIGHLPYLIHNWLHEDMVNLPIAQFPYQLMDYNSLHEFVSCHQDLLISEILVTKLSMADVSGTLGFATEMELHQALLSALPCILVHILPGFAATLIGSQTSISAKLSVRATKCYSVLEAELSEKVIKESVYEKLGDIIVHVLNCLQTDREEGDDPPTQRMMYPHPNPPFYHYDVIQVTLDYLAQNFAVGSLSQAITLTSVLAKMPDGIHQVLLSLSTLLWQQHQVHEQQRHLQMYGLFVKMLLKELEMGLEGGWAAVIRDVINRLLVILEDRVEQFSALTSPSYEEDVILTALDILHSLCSKAVNVCPDEMANYIHRITDTVSIVVAMSESICEAGQHLLTTLMAAHASDSEDLTKVMKILNPLPDIPQLQDLRDQVQKLTGQQKMPLFGLLKTFVDVCQLVSHPSQGLAERLHQLTTMIICNPKELESLTNSDEGLSMLRKAVYELLKLVTSLNQKVASASASCLGAIGPLNLHSISLPWKLINSSCTVALQVYRGHEYEKYCWLYHALDFCLLDKSLEVVKTAGSILKRTMSTPSSGHFESHYRQRLKDQTFLFDYLHPFKPSDRDKLVTAAPPALTKEADIQSFKLVDNSELWLGRDSNLNPSYENWIKELVSTLLQTGAVQDVILQAIGPMCSLKADFCGMSLPYLIHDILQAEKENYRAVLSQHISAFFHTHCVLSSTLTSEDRPHGTQPICVNKEAVRTMMNVIQYLRKQNRSQKRHGIPQTTWQNNFWLDIDYLEVARAAQYCHANFSAILYIEIWWDIHSQSSNSAEASPCFSISLLTTSLSLGSQGISQTCSFPEEDGQKVQELLLDAYKEIGDPDGIYGSGAGRMADPLARVQTYLHEQQQEKALTTLDIEVCYRSASSVTPLLQVLQSCGADYVLQQCLSELNQQKDGSSLSASGQQELEEFQYQAAWKLGQWNHNLPAKQSKAAPFNQSLYKALVSLKDGHLEVARLAVAAARCNIVKRFDPHVETCQNLYKFLSQLQCLTHLQQIIEQLPGLTNSSSQESFYLLNEESSDAIMSAQSVTFDHKKLFLHLLASVAKVLDIRGIKSSKTLEIKALWNLAVTGRQAAHYQLAEKALYELKVKVREEEASQGIRIQQLQLEEAKMFWARQEVDIAKSLLKSLVLKLSKSPVSSQDNPSFYAEALCTYGNWLAETKSETPAVIMKDYLEKTVQLISASSRKCQASDQTLLEGFVSLARFADEQYQQITDYIRSPTYEDKRNLLLRSKTELEECRQLREQSKYLKVMEKTLAIDKQELEALEDDHSRFLHQALLNYLKCLQTGNCHNLKVFRVVALWFENSKKVEVNRLIEESIDKIQTYKFLPLYYQLAARMSSSSGNSNNFQHVLIKLMEMVARDHPHHALWIVMALAHAYKDDEILNKDSSSTKSRAKQANGNSQIEEERVQAAKMLLKKLRNSGSRLLSQIVANMEQLCIAYIELANFTVLDKTNRRPQPLPASLAIVKSSHWDNVLLPSVELPVDPSGSYTNLVSPVKFSPEFRVVGGINLPKIITCLGSDGQERTQLVKGQDDLRQDAVMQQVFCLVNQLLTRDEETRQRHLSIRTYKVVPLSQKCGLLQWCEGTQPMGEYLIGNNGAHQRYRPGDWSFKKCRDEMVEAHKAGKKTEDKLKAYQKVCAKFKPVFRHFFLEKFLEPSLWFEQRLAYTRSVATNSIVGYILGLGDRHLMNILIDLKTAELVHIDLGIAFEQGRLLPTPELVPFRLTRDIVDGMGVTGVEGVFRRCCEKTMEVMKNNCESLLTIVQVLLYDPLSHWSLTPQQALAIQRKREQANNDTIDLVPSGQVTSSGQVPYSGQVAGASVSGEGNMNGRNKDNSENQNKLAERTLLRLRQKLEGQEDGILLSISGQVNFLIQKASDPKNLCSLFPGWQPYL